MIKKLAMKREYAIKQLSREEKLRLIKMEMKINSFPSFYLKNNFKVQINFKIYLVTN